MTTELATRVPAQLPESVEQALIGGNLAELKPAERVKLYMEVCGSLGLNPLTVPFQYITLNGKLVLYALKSCTDQLRFIHSVNVEIVSRERLDDIYVVTTKATLPNGRTDEEIGAVPIAGVKGEALANALMKASTKAKRRVTLAIVGLSLLDETEIESIRDARQPLFQVGVDPDSREIVETALSPARSLDGETMRPPKQTKQPTIEELRDSWATLWNAAQRRGIQMEDFDMPSWSYQELMDNGRALKARIEAHDAGSAP